MARQKPARPFYEVFLERVIVIEAVQRHRPEAIDAYASGFFDGGRLLGDMDDFQWALDEPQIFSSAGVQFVVGPYGITRVRFEPKLSSAMQAAWAAARGAWATIVGELRGGTHVVIASHRSDRRELDPAELLLPGWVDVRAGRLLGKGPGGKPVELWTAVTVRTGNSPRKALAGELDSPGRGYAWGRAWKFAVTLRQAGRWDWTKHPRHETQPLPMPEKVVLNELQTWFKQEHNGNCPVASDIYKNIIAPLYAGGEIWVKRVR